MCSMSFKTEKQMLYIIAFNGAYFLLAVMVEGDESSRPTALIDSPAQE